MPLAYLDRVSCFETLRAYGGKIFHWKEHSARLFESCLALNEPVPAGGLAEWVSACLDESGMKDALLRLSVHWRASGEGVFVLLIRPFQSHPRRLYEQGVRLETAVQRRWTLRAQDPQIKASQFVAGVLAVSEKKDPSAHELVFLGSAGTVAEGTVSNLFVAYPGKRLLTPSASSGILKGVTRSVVMDLARQRGWRVGETFLTRHDIYSARECFLTNTSSEILPVVALDGRKIGNGAPGPFTQTLAEDFKKRIGYE